MTSLRQNKLLISFVISLNLTGCSTPVVEKKFDEIEKKITCRLSNFRVRGPINIVLDTLEDKTVGLLFSLNSFAYLTNMHHNPKVLIKIYNGATPQELPFQGSSKDWLEESYNQYKANKTIAFSPRSTNPYNLDYAIISIPTSDFLRIAQAERIEFFVQTNRDPAKVELVKEDLEWFRSFHKTCFSQ